MGDLKEPQIIRTPAGDDLVVLTRAEYNRLMSAAAEALEDAADAALFDERMADVASGVSPQLPPDVSMAMLRGDSRLRALRKWRGLTQVDLAQRAGLAQSILSDVEAGRRRLTDQSARRIAKALKIDVDWIA